MSNGSLSSGLDGTYYLESVIARVHFLAKGMPAFPTFTDRARRVIGDVINEVQYDKSVIENEFAPAKTLEVHTEETQADTTGVDTAQD